MPDQYFDKPSPPPMPDQKVSLGCGTLILIALIVLFFSGGNDIKGVRDELRRTRDEIRALRVAIDAQSAQLRELRDALARPGIPAPPPPPGR